MIPMNHTQVNKYQNNEYSKTLIHMMRERWEASWILERRSRLGGPLLLRLRFPTVTHRYAKERYEGRRAGGGASRCETQGVRAAP